MKGNKGVNGESLPALPFVFREGTHLDPLTTLMPGMLPQLAAKKRRSPMRAVLLPLVAVLAVAIVLAVVGSRLQGKDADQPAAPVETTNGAANDSGSPGNSPASEVPVMLAPSTATATSTNTNTPTTVSTATNVPPTATATPSGLVRVRYVVGAGESCHSIRAKFGVPYDDAETFFTAMGRLTGKSEATQCSFFPGDVVCVPALADLNQVGVLVRDVACMTGG